MKKRFLYVMSCLVFILISNSLMSAKYIIPSDNKVMIKYGDARFGALDPNSIKILVWNVYKGENGSFANDFQSLIQDTDFVIIQESYLDKKTVNLVMNHTYNAGFEYRFATSFIYEKNSIPTGVMTGSWYLPSSTVFQRSQYTEPIIGTPKMVLITKYPIQGSKETLLVANIHGLNATNTEKFLKQVDKVVAEIGKHSGPAIFAGDFNTRNDDRMKGVSQRMRKIGMVPTSFNPDHRMKKSDIPLDHVFYRGLQVRSSGVPVVGGSDHAPMVVEFSVILPTM